MPDTHNAETTELIQRYLDRVITDAELRTLNASLAASPAARRAFIKATYHARLIAENLADAVAIAAPPKPDDERQRVVAVPSPQPTTNRRWAIVGSAIAAALIAACGLAAYLLTTSVDPEPTDPPNHPGTAVATLIQNTGNLTTPHGYPAEGDDYSSGEYTLSTGAAEFMLTNAVNVKLRGNTRIHMRNNMDVSLKRGSSQFFCPTEAKGFTVHLPGGAKVVDLGTRFDIDVDALGAATIRVRQGIVELWSGGAMQRIEAGRWAATDRRGRAVPPAQRLMPVADAVEAEGPVTIVSAPPKSLASGAIKSDRQITVVAERAAVELPEPLTVTLDSSGSHTEFSEATASLPAGLTVASVLIHFEPETRVGNDAAHVLEATLRFDRPVLGLAATNAHLAGSDKILGTPGVDFGDTTNRHLEGRSNNPQKFDTVELSEDRRTLRLRLTTTNARDQLRVVLDSAPQKETPRNDPPSNPKETSP